MARQHLQWRLPASLERYVLGLPDGEIVATAPAQREPGAAMFPARDAAIAPRQFAGALTIIGHGGLMDIRLSDPWIEDNEGVVVSVEVDGLRTPMLALATDDHDSTVPVRATIRAEVIDLFGGAYLPGAAFGEVRID